MSISTSVLAMSALLTPRLRACGACRGEGARFVRRVRRPCKRCAGVGLEPGEPAPSDRPGVDVAVVGGGLGGAALALALQHRGISVRVFEADDSFDTRAQGYALTMQQGANALKLLGLPNEGGSAPLPLMPRRCR